MDDVAQQQQNLPEQLKAEHYKPQPVRRVMMPEKRVHQVLGVVSVYRLPRVRFANALV